MRHSLRSFLSNILFAVHYTFTYRRSYFLFWLGGILTSVANTWVPILYFRYIIDLLTQSAYKSAILVTLLFSLMVFALSIVSDWFTVKQDIQGAQLSNRLKAQLSQKQMELSYDVLDRTVTREFYDLAKRSVEESSIGTILSNFAAIISNIITAFGVLFVFSYLNFYVAFLFVLIIVFNSVGIVKRISYAYEQTTQETPIERNLYYARDYLTSPVFAKEVRTFRLAGFISGKIQSFIEKHFYLEIETSHKYFKHFWWTYAVNGLQFLLVYLYIGYLLYEGRLTVSDFTVCISSVFVFGEAAVSSIRAAANTVKSCKHIGILRDFLCYQEKTSAKETIPMPDMKEEYSLSFVHVYFRYGEDLPYVIEDLTIDMKSSDTICIVGRNGAGKTTLVKLLMGLYSPTRGEILLNGQNITAYDPKDYLSLFSTVFQDFNIFDFTIGENVAMQEDYDETRVKGTLHKADLSPKIDSLRAGTSSYITQRMDQEGIDLSGGEKQMLAIARAFYKDAPIYILDEPTAALSPRREYVLYEKFKDITKGKTVFYISHRMSSCRLADKILVLESGHLVETGNHEELMEINGSYAQMFQLQAQYYESGKVQ